MLRCSRVPSFKSCTILDGPHSVDFERGALIAHGRRSKHHLTQQFDVVRWRLGALKQHTDNVTTRRCQMTSRGAETHRQVKHSTLDCTRSRQDAHATLVAIEDNSRFSACWQVHHRRHLCYFYVLKNMDVYRSAKQVFIHNECCFIHKDVL